MSDPTIPVPAPSARTTVRRKADRARYDRDSVAAILDAGLIAHVGFSAPGGVLVLPMAYARVGDHLYLHGAAGNAMLKRLATGIDVCVTVTIVDGIVLSRSAFHHSMNYRSVVVVGEAQSVRDEHELEVALRAIVDHTLPGRSDDCRGPSRSEIRQTRVIRLPITEASAKVRIGPPIEEPGDLETSYWGGVLPVSTSLGAPIADEYAAEMDAPTYAR